MRLMGERFRSRPQKETRSFISRVLQLNSSLNSQQSFTINNQPSIMTYKPLISQQQLWNYSKSIRIKWSPLELSKALLCKTLTPTKLMLLEVLFSRVSYLRDLASLSGCAIHLRKSNLLGSQIDLAEHMVGRIKNNSTGLLYVSRKPQSMVET
jgi:hypothetical protein